MPHNNKKYLNRRHRVQFYLSGEDYDKLNRIRDFYSEPVTKVLLPDLKFLIGKHIERIETPPGEALKKK